MGIAEARTRVIKSAGNFEAWIVANDNPNDDYSAGPSAHAWEIYRTGSGALEDSNAASSPPGSSSDESNGYVTAVYRVLEAVPHSSSVHIFSANDYVVFAFSKHWLDEVWIPSGYRRADGRPLAHEAYWRLIAELRRDANLQVTAERLKSRSDWKHGDNYKRLMIRVRRALEAYNRPRPGRDDR
ncbi:MAG TPA: hypothetical protein VNR11_12360 [Xanthobacteraceae bacterium]|nr:hypothetical protein [Xanthobacteraceae bacterium]